MPKTIQIRHVPNAVHRRLKARAAKFRMSLSGYLLQELRERASWQAMNDEAGAPALNVDIDIARLVREGRDSR
jgi:antitoxin FitA